MKGKNHILKTGHTDGRFIGHPMIWLCMGQVTDINIIRSLELWWVVYMIRDMGKQTCKMSSVEAKIRCLVFTIYAKE